MKYSALGTASGLLCAWLVLPAFAGERCWEKFPPPPGRSAGVSAIGLDRAHDLWIMSGQGAYFWDREKREWSDAVLSSGQYLTGLYGTPQTGLFATQGGTKENWGEVHRLEKGHSTLVTTFYYEASFDYPGFRVARDGRLFNWGGGKIRVYQDGEWTESQAELKQTDRMFLDQAGCVSLYARGKLYVADKNGKVETVVVDAAITGDLIKGAAWARDKAILLSYGRPCVAAFEIPSGRRVVTDDINRVLGGRAVYDLFSTPDGAVSVLAADPESSGYVLYRISAEGETTLVRETAGIPWDNHQFTYQPGTVLSDGRGALWFACKDIGIQCLKEQELRQFRHWEDDGPATCHVLAAGDDGVIYAGSENGLYAYNNGASLTGRPRPARVPLSKLDTPAWTYPPVPSGKIELVWSVDGQVIAQRGGDLVALDLETGRARFAAPISGVKWVSAGTQPGELTVCLEDRVLCVDAADGKVIRSLECPRDPRIAPLAVGSDLILVTEPRGATVTRLKASGKPVWSCPLAGYLMRHPAISGSIIFLQTRGGSYGGQKSWGIDTETGKVLWSDTTDAYGAGGVFADDARRCVEADCWLSPQATEARVIAREPGSGRVLWRYSRSGTTVDHSPVLDPLTDRIYVAMDDGMVACLDGTNGAALWEAPLPQPPMTSRSSSYDDPYASCMSLGVGVLSVMDQGGVLHLLASSDGKFLGRFVPAREILRHGKWAGFERLLAAPFLVENLLIVPREDGLSAFSLVALGCVPQGRPPQLAWDEEPPRRIAVADLALKIRASGSGERLTLRYQCGSSGWKREMFEPPRHDIVIRQIPNGVCTLRLQVYDRLGRPSTELTCTLEVNRDYDAEVAALAVRLGSADFREREEAQATLVKMGPQIIPVIKKYLDGPDPEVRERVKWILEALGGS